MPPPQAWLDLIQHARTGVNVSAVAPQGGFLSLEKALQEHRKLTWTPPDGPVRLLTDEIGPMDAVFGATADDKHVAWVHRRGGNPDAPWDIWVYDHQTADSVPVKITSSAGYAPSGEPLSLPWPFPHLAGDLVYWEQSPKLGTVSGYVFDTRTEEHRTLFENTGGRVIPVGSTVLRPDPARPGFLEQISLQDGATSAGPPDPGFAYVASDGKQIVGTTPEYQFWTWNPPSEPVRRLSTTTIWMQFPEVNGRWASIDEEGREPIIDLESGSYVSLWTDTRRAAIRGAALVVKDQGVSHIVMLRDLPPLPACR